jgi:hypothetical protein
MKMVERKNPEPPLKMQADLLSLIRSSLYYQGHLAYIENL